MPPVTVALLRRRAEHNGGCLASLRELALAGEGVERIELLGRACRGLRLLYLQNNLIARVEGLHRLKVRGGGRRGAAATCRRSTPRGQRSLSQELEYLNLALNNLTRVRGLAGCESLRRLDLTANFVGLRELPASLRALRANAALEELHLLGNPCTRWAGCRAYVVGLLPQLQRLDGEKVRPSERIAARAASDHARKRAR